MPGGSDHHYFLDTEQMSAKQAIYLFQKYWWRLTSETCRNSNCTFCKTKIVVSFWERVNKLDTEVLILENVIACFSSEMPFVIAFIPSDLRRARKCWVSWIRSIQTLHIYLTRYVYTTSPRHIVYRCKSTHSRLCQVGLTSYESVRIARGTPIKFKSFRFSCKLIFKLLSKD